MANPIIGDIDYTRGDSYPLKLTISNSSTKLPIDLTGYALTLSVHSIKNPIDVSTLVFSVNGIVNEDQVGNKGVVVFTPSKTNTTRALKGFYDIEMSYGPGRIYTKTIVNGYKFNIAADKSNII